MITQIFVVTSRCVFLATFCLWMAANNMVLPYKVSIRSVKRLLGQRTERSLKTPLWEITEAVVSKKRDVISKESPNAASCNSENMLLPRTNDAQIAALKHLIGGGRPFKAPFTGSRKYQMAEMVCPFTE